MPPAVSKEAGQPGYLIDRRYRDRDPDYMRKLHLYRQRNATSLVYYRLGKQRLWEEECDQPELWRNYDLPLPGKAPGHENDKQKNSMINIQSLPKFDLGDKGVSNLPEEIQKELENIPLYIVSPQAQIGFRKFLGFGGNGLAAMYTIQDLKGRTRDVVFKYALNAISGNELENEKQMHRYLARARHITQRVYLRPPERKKNTAPLPGVDPRVVAGGLVSKAGGGLVSKAGGLVSKAGPSRRTITPTPAPPPAPPPDDDPDGSTDTDDGTGAKGYPVQAFHHWNYPQDRTVERSNIGKVDDNGPTLILEMMRRGGLESWIGRMSLLGQALPEKVLWLIFDCLLKAALALAYPPRFQEELYNSTHRHLGKYPINEILPPSEYEMSPDLVHFDLDATNLFVGDFADNDSDITHTMVPIIKLADFGMTTFMRNAMRNDPKLMHISRPRGKYWLGWLLPEQFTEEWDYITGFLPAEETDPEKKSSIAGKYSYKTNLYHVGLVMWGLITLRKLPFSPVPYECFEKEVTDPDTGNPVLDPKTGQPKMRKLWGYGGYLQGKIWDGIYDRVLLDLVVACMLEEPEQRPAFHELKQAIDREVKSEWEWQRNADVRKWCEQFFNEPAGEAPVVPIVPVANPAPVPVPPEPEPAAESAQQPQQPPPPPPPPPPTPTAPPAPPAPPPPPPLPLAPDLTTPQAPQQPQQPFASTPTRRPGRQTTRLVRRHNPIDPTQPRAKLLRRKPETQGESSRTPQAHIPAAPLPSTNPNLPSPAPQQPPPSYIAAVAAAAAATDDDAPPPPPVFHFQSNILPPGAVIAPPAPPPSTPSRPGPTDDYIIKVLTPKVAGLHLTPIPPSTPAPLQPAGRRTTRRVLTPVGPRQRQRYELVVPPQQALYTPDQDSLDGLRKVMSKMRLGTPEKKSTKNKQPVDWFKDGGKEPPLGPSVQARWAAPGGVRRRWEREGAVVVIDERRGGGGGVGRSPPPRGGVAGGAQSGVVAAMADAVVGRPRVRRPAIIARIRRRGSSSGGGADDAGRTGGVM